MKLRMGKKTTLLLAAILMVIALIIGLKCTVFPSNSYHASAVSGKYSVCGDILEIKDGKNKITIQVCKQDVLKVNYMPNGVSSPHTLVLSDQKWKSVGAKINYSSDPITIETNKIKVKINKSTLGISVYDSNNNLLIQEQDLINKYKNVSFKHEKADKFYGIYGYSAAMAIDEKITREDGGNVEAGNQGGCGAPFVWSTSGYGMLVDSNGGKFVIDSSNLKFNQISRKDIEYYILLGKPEEILSEVSSLSGRPPIFPKWAMGFTNSEWEMDQKELKEIVNTYRSKNIPLDNYTLDFDWKRWGEDNYGEFQWNTTKFPDAPSGKLKTWADSVGLKITGIMKPRLHMDTVQGRYATEKGYWWPGKEPYLDYFSNQSVNDLDFSKADCRNWFWNNLKGAYDTGMIGWWNDEADVGFDNFEGLNMQRALFENQKNYNNKRAWSINRNFYLGAQRYAYGMWSGDIETGFDAMAAQRVRMLAAVNLGQVKWGMDTGGFLGHPNSENYARWMQFSAFTPIFRVHGIQYEQRQPWIYGKKAEAVATDAIRLRYKLIPYIYSYEREAFETGIGLVRPLTYDYPEDKNAADKIDSWMFGDSMLVSPVIEEGQKEKKIYLPKGVWYDYSKGTRYDGGNTINYKLDSNTWSDIPLFIKEGAIIPSQDVMNYVGEKPVTKIYMDVFPAEKETSFKYYDDDGETYDYMNGKYFSQTIKIRDNKDSANLSIGTVKGSYKPELKYYILKIHGRSDTKVMLNGLEVKQYNSVNEMDNVSGEGWATGKDIYGSVTYVRVAAGSEKNITISGAATGAIK